MTQSPPIPEEPWETASPVLQVAILVTVERLERRITDREERLNTNASKPPSSETCQELLAGETPL